MSRNRDTPISSFLTYLLAERGAATNTARSYQRDLRAFDDYLDRTGTSIDRTATSHIEGFLSHLVSRGLSPGSSRRALSAIRHFFKFLVLRGVLERSPATNVQPPRQWSQLPSYLSSEEIDKLLNAPDTDQPRGLRDRTMLEVMYATGMRVSELCSLKTTDLNISERVVLCTGKGAKQRFIPVGSVAVTWVKKYIKRARPLLLKELRSPLLFVSHRGTGLTRQFVWQMIKRYAAECGLRRNVHPHILRHSFATHLLENDADLLSIKMMLGHSDLSTTQIYTHVAKERLKALHAKYHPRG